MSNRYARFLNGDIRDDRGRSVNSLILRSDEEIENDCTALQWLFPTHEKSPIEPSAWQLTAEDIYCTQRWNEAKVTHFAAIARMKQFYDENDMWLVVGDHNHKRITRIIMNISLVQGLQHARNFYHNILQRHYVAGGPVNVTTLQFWKQAAGLD